MCKLISSLWHDDRGAAAAEYALILAIVGAGIATAAGALGTSISSAISRTSSAIDAVNS